MKIGAILLGCMSLCYASRAIADEGFKPHEVIAIPSHEWVTPLHGERCRVQHGEFARVLRRDDQSAILRYMGNPRRAHDCLQGTIFSADQVRFFTEASGRSALIKQGDDVELAGFEGLHPLWAEQVAACKIEGGDTHFEFVADLGREILVAYVRTHRSRWERPCPNGMFFLISKDKVVRE